MGGRRRTWSFLASALAAFAAFLPGPAASQIPVGGWMSPNVEWLGNVTLSGTTGAVTGLLHDKYFYAEGLEAIEIFDVSDPTAPQAVSRIPMAAPEIGTPPLGFPDIARNGIDTNGRILLVNQAFSPPLATDVSDRVVLSVWDVRDKESPRELASLVAKGIHFECLLDCRWAYGSSGEIVDLRDPAHPVLAEGRWHERLDFNHGPYREDGPLRAEEIAPGRVLALGIPFYLLDVQNPRRPRVLARSDGSPHSYGAIVWPGPARNGVAMSVSQTVLAPRCEVQDLLQGSSIDSAFKTWDVSDWRATGLMTGLSEHRLRNGTYTDGDPAFSGGLPLLWGCGMTYLSAHPRFSSGGLVAVSSSSHGVKFLEIDKSGAIEQVGWFLPYANDTFGAHWITDEIVYTVDWPRGIDILRFDPNA